MKGEHNKKSVRVEFVMSEPEAELGQNAWRNLALPTVGISAKHGEMVTSFTLIWAIQEMI